MMTKPPAAARIVPVLAVTLCAAATSYGAPAAKTPTVTCFLLHEVGIGEIRRTGEGCRVRVTPASTFKIPHALAGLDAGVLDGPEALRPYDGAKMPFPAWERNHTLASAMRYSVVWYFQRLAKELGPTREREYLVKLDYGNHDSTSGLTSFWLGGSLLISPEEQEQFLLRLYRDGLPVSARAMHVVRSLLVQPPNVVMNASGEHPFAAPWPKGIVLSAKPGSGTDRSGKQVRWLVGHIKNGNRSWVFVACVTGGADTGDLAAVEMADHALRENGVLW